MLFEIALKFIFLIGFIVISPILIISIVLIFLEDGMPVLFVQKRLGRHENVFSIFKLRTMKNDTPDKGTHEIDKNHYLNFGSVLRKIKVDELPQILNFLKGDINLIGPRPGLPSQSDLRHHRSIHNVFDIKPGITGLSQVLGYDMSDPETLAKVDKIYIERKSIRLDIMIFVATFFKPLRKRIAILLAKELNQINHV